MTARWRARLIALALVVGTFAAALVAQRDVGVARDETVYMGAGDGYAKWWIDAVHLRKGTFSHQGITAAWGGPGANDHNREHPPFMKTLFGLSHRVLHGGFGVAHTTAYRAPSALMHALLVLIVFAWVLAAWGEAEAVLAALFTLCLPRALFHAGLACFDGPIATLWVATLYCYWRALARWTWAIATGVVWGLALATKHNALLLPFAIAPHFAWVVGRAAWARTPRGSLRAVRALGRGLGERWYVPALMIVLGPLTLIAVWPWLWFDTVAHIRAWLNFHLHHVHYNFEYLGDNWNHPPFPWHVAVVTTLVTVPAGTLAAAAVGAAVHVRGWWRARGGAATEPGLLLALSLAASMGPFFLGSTPIFGAEKHWMVASYTIAAAAGLGAVWAARRAAEAIVARWPRVPATRARIVAIVVMGAVLIGAAAAETLHAQPYALSSYNALAGGAPGGADLGMNRQFWGYAARGVLPVLRAEAPPAGAPARPVYTHDASPAWGWYRKAGLVPASLPDAGREESGVARSALAIVIHELHFNRHDYLVWDAYGTVQPSYVLRFDGVPLVSVYRRPAAPTPP